MGGGKSNAPEPPDPYQTAQAQTGMNVGTAIANQVMGMTNQNTPFGTLQYKQRKNPYTMTIGGQSIEIPRYRAITTLSPAQQKLMDTQGVAKQNLAEGAASASGRLGTLLGKPMTLNGAPKVAAPQLGTVGNGPELGRVGNGPELGRVGGGPKLQANYENDFSKDRQRVEGALMSRMQPQMDRDRASMEASLAAKGIAPGSVAYDRQMDELNRSGTDARMQAILAGGEEQSRLAGLTRDEAMFGNDARQTMYGNRVGAQGFNNAAAQQQYGNRIGAQGFNNAAAQQQYGNRLGAQGFNNQVAQQGFGNQQSMRDNWLQEQFGLRNQNINEIGALLGTGQVQSPQFQSTPGGTAATTDYAGLQNANYNQKLAAWQQQQQAGQGMLGGLFGLGSSAILGWPFG